MANRSGLTAVAGAVVVIAVGIQLVPIDDVNPPVEMEIDAPANVTSILERACYDCHSHGTRWPWYSQVAPISWLVAHDVHEGREHLNFSRWNRLDPEERLEAVEEIWEEVEEGEMPLWFYLPLHPEARLTEDDLGAIRAWALGDGA